MDSLLSVSFRKAAQRDVPQLADMYANTFRPWIQWEKAPEYMAGMIDNPQFDFTVAEDKPGHLAGFIVTNNVMLESHGWMNVDVMAVDPGTRRKGLGRALMAEAEKGATEAGAKGMMLQVVETNEPAKNLYLSLNFNIVGENQRYYRDGSNALLMLKLLPAFFGLLATASSTNDNTAPVPKRRPEQGRRLG